MMDEVGAQVISLAAQAGAALTIASSPAAASAVRPGPWVWVTSVIVAPLLRALSRHGGWSGSGGGRTRPPTRGVADRAGLVLMFIRLRLARGGRNDRGPGNRAP